MALTTAVHDSLPYIDTEPTASERSAAQALIDAEILPADILSHPSLPQLPAHNFTPLVEAEHQRIANKEPRTGGVDLKRYEALSPQSDERHPEASQKWRAALAQAYISHSYLMSRKYNLALLEEFGKNAWLIGNSQLEDVLRGLERELTERKTEIDILAVERRNAQESVVAEVKGLEEAWKRGVGKVLEIEVATEGLRREVLERRKLDAI